MRAPRPLVVCLVVAAVTSSVGAWAQSPRAAQAVFEAGVAQYDKKDYAGALDRFREAYAATHSPNARLYVARALRELGRMGEALDEMRGALAEASARAAKEPRYGATRDAVAAELATLERSISTLTVAIDGGGEGVEVRIGAETIAPDRLGKPMILKPGRVTIVASSPGRATITREVQLRGGERETVAIAFGEGAAAAPVVVAPPPPPEAPPSSGGTVRKIGFGVAGLGVVGGVVFAITGAMASSKFNEVETGCGGARCTDPKYADVVSSGRALTTVANVGLVVGIAGVVGGAGMIVFGGPRAQTSVAAGPSGLALSTRF